VRAAVAARATLAAGFTTIRDLGSEGAGAADAGLRDAFALGIAPGPRMFVATRAIVATGTYLPRGFAPEVCACIPQAAQEADGVEALRRVAREQIRAGAGCDTIEHGTGGTPAVFALMAQHGTVLCPTLAANDALARLRDKPERVTQARAAMMHAMQAGVTIACGSDAGPYPHGENATELALLVDYGMAPLEALRAATSRAADVLRRPDLGRLEAGARADIVAVEGDLAGDLRALRDVRFVMQNGRPID